MVNNTPSGATIYKPPVLMNSPYILICTENVIFVSTLSSSKNTSILLSAEEQLADFISLIPFLRL